MINPKPRAYDLQAECSEDVYWRIIAAARDQGTTIAAVVGQCLTDAFGDKARHAGASNRNTSENR